MCYTQPGALATSESGTALVLSTLFSSVDSDGALPNGTALDANELLRRAAAAWTDAQARGAAALLESHVAGARSLSTGRIEVAGAGDELADVARVINASQYALLATVREGVRYSSSPGGLATTAYHGHTFWDVETWMWPNWLASMGKGICGHSQLPSPQP